MSRLCDLQEITYSVDNAVLIDSVSFDIEAGKIYAVVGGNGSGKTTLAEIIAGKKQATRGKVRYHELPHHTQMTLGYLSFEEQEEVLARERKRDETWLGHGKIDYGSTGAELIGFEELQPDLQTYIRLLRIEDLLHRGCRQFSTGEFRKVLLCRELYRRPALLLLDEPYDGLDIASRKHVYTVLPRLREQGGSVMLFLQRLADVPDYAEKILYLYKGKLHDDPPSRQMHHNLAGSLQKNTADELSGDDQQAESLVRLSEVGVTYDRKPVLRGITWEAREGETWMITGPNGSGKSTLLSLINGDNPKAYGQKIFLFGRKRGSGESIWDIKKKIGFVSGDFQYRYHVRASVEEVVLSGLFDSIGLYEKVSSFERQTALSWLRDIGLAKKISEPFQRLSFGEQRMVLLVRAVIKGPKVLIADEPCQGLDDVNREDVLRALEVIAGRGKTLLLYVTHDPREHLHIPYRHMELISHSAGGFTNRIVP